MKLRNLVFGMLIAFTLTACDDDPRTGGTIVGPLEGPRIAESVLALDVIDGAPAGITDVFEVGDIVNLWIHWIALEPPHDIEVVWWDPTDGNYSSTLTLTDAAVEQVTVFTIEFGALSPTGRWEVEIYIDDEFMRSILFDVLPSP